MTQADWVKELLEERFPFGVYTDIDTDVTDEMVELIKKIITLAQQRTEKKWRDKCESIGKDREQQSSIYEDGYNQAIDDLLK